MTNQTTSMGTATLDTPTVTTVTSSSEIFGKAIDYLKSLNLPLMLTDYGIKLSVNNAVIDMYIYNATWVLHAVINNERNSLSSDMYVKQIQDHCGTYLVSYEKEKTKVWVKMKISGNSIWDVNIPLLALARAVELAGKSLTFLLPPSLQ